MNSSDDLGNHPRVQALLERFRSVDAAMRDLPLYNDKVAIEAIGFRAFGADALLGVALTPWFINLMVLPIERAAMDVRAIGKKVVIELPAGQRTFVVGGDGMIGLYKAHSLHSPVLNFTLPGQAHAVALRELRLLMSAPGPMPGGSANGVDRRALLFGRRATATPGSAG
jgi:[NiFe] hydrogenase assembly HybE family chaperone